MRKKIQEAFFFKWAGKRVLLRDREITECQSSWLLLIWGNIVHVNLFPLWGFTCRQLLILARRSSGGSLYAQRDEESTTVTLGMCTA